MPVFAHLDSMVVGSKICLSSPCCFFFLRGCAWDIIGLSGSAAFLGGIPEPGEASSADKAEIHGYGFWCAGVTGLHDHASRIGL